MRIVWEGNCDISGFGRAGVDYIKALVKLQGESIKVIDRSMPTMRQVKLPIDLKNIRIKSVARDDIHIQHVTPRDFRKSEAHINIGYTTFESPLILPEWVENLDLLDGIIVPSEFNRNILIDAGLSKNKVFVVPHIVKYVELDPDKIKPFVIRNRKKFAFLAILDFTYRKGWDVLLEAFWKEFKPDEDVCLILKAYHRSFGKADRNTVEEHVLDMKNKLKLTNVASTLVYNWPLHDALLPSLYRTAQCYVFPTRGEGFSLTCAEAMALEVPVIATHFGGHLDYMDFSNSNLIRNTGLRTMTNEQLLLSPQYESLPLAQPSVEHLRELMRSVYVHYDDAMDKAKKARNDVAKFSEIKIGVQMLDTIERIAYR